MYLRLSCSCSLSLIHRIKLIYLSNVDLVSSYLSSWLIWLIGYSLCLCMCLSLRCLIRNSTNLVHYCVDIIGVIRWRNDLLTDLLQSLSGKLSKSSSNTLCVMKMRYLHLMPIIKVAWKSTVSNSICISDLLSLRYGSILYDILSMWVLLRYLLCIILLVCTRFVSNLLDIKTNHMTVVLRRISLQTSICGILSK